MVDSALFIGGYLIQLVANGGMLVSMHRRQSAYGLSMETQVMFLIATVCRAVWSTGTRLAETRMAYLELALSLGVSLAILAYGWVLRGSEPRGAKAPRAEGFTLWAWLNEARAPALVAACAALAAVAHPGDSLWSMQVLVALSIYLEAVALVPQLRLMRKMVEIEPLTGGSVWLIVMSRAVRLGFWFTLFLKNENFLALFLADVVHCLLCADFALQWTTKFDPGRHLRALLPGGM